MSEREDQTNYMKVRRALISVSDKSGIGEFASALREQGVELLSTGGTYRLLQELGLEVTEVADYTGFPEMMDGRVKTLHPKVHGGILALRDVLYFASVIGFMLFATDVVIRNR